MAAISWSDVIDVDGALASGVPSGTQTAILAHVENECVNATKWDRFHFAARVRLAAHLGTVYKRGTSGQAGALVSESIGGISRAYAPPPMDSGTLSTTPHGAEFARLRRLLGSTRGGLVA